MNTPQTDKAIKGTAQKDEINGIDLPQNPKIPKFPKRKFYNKN